MSHLFSIFRIFIAIYIFNKILIFDFIFTIITDDVADYYSKMMVIILEMTLKREDFRKNNGQC